MTMTDVGMIGALFTISLSCAIIHGLLEWCMKPGSRPKERVAGFAPMLLVLVVGTYGIRNPQKGESVAVVFMGIGIGLLLHSILLVTGHARSALRDSAAPRS